MQPQARDRKGTETITLAELRPVLEVLKKINTERHLRRLLTLVLDRMMDFCGARRGLIGIFKGAQFRSQLSRDRSGKPLGPADVAGFQSVLKSVRDHGRKVLSGNARKDPQLAFSRSSAQTSALSILCLPLRVKEKIIGAVYMDAPGVEDAFGAREVEISEVLTEHAAIAVENAELHHETTHDRLTRVSNHGHFEKRLKKEVSRSRKDRLPVAVLMIDADDFKKINDTLGHAAGNAVLKHMAKTIGGTVRSADLVARAADGRTAHPLVARYGGDEFEIILPATGREGALRTARRLVEVLSQQKLEFGGRTIRLSISAGAAVFPDDAADAHELQLRADEALYQCKRAGKNRALLFGAPIPRARPS